MSFIYLVPTLDSRYTDEEDNLVTSMIWKTLHPGFGDSENPCGTERKNNNDF